MSARSPRGSLSGASSAEVADDFGESLKDLQLNNRYEISNLTIIAKENTEHAQAISKTLENHIKTTAPIRKLPALYVLDSIVKNVGTPYTVYLGRNLFHTFMDAYTLVPVDTRRNMEGMLKTWKEPVPGALDTTPVFPPEIVRPIENALIKFRTIMVQNNRQGHAPQQQHSLSRNTPTPPQSNGRYVAPPSHGQASQPYYGKSVQQPSSHQPPSLTPIPSFQQVGYSAADSRPVNDVNAIKRDVSAVIAQRQAQFASDIGNASLRNELTALIQLQQVLETQALNADALQQVRDQISNLATVPRATPQVAAAQPTWQPTPVPQAPTPQFSRATPVAYPQPPAYQPPPQTSARPFLDPAALSSLQAILANGHKPGTPQLRAAAPALQHATHTQLNNVQTATAALPALNSADLIASLSRNNLLPPANPTPTPRPSPALPTSVPSTTDLLKALTTSGLFPTPPPTLIATNKPSSIPFSQAALKPFRPALLAGLYSNLPNQCSTCGRRFPASEEGREKKSRHLDWHFRTNQRMADSNVSRGGHRGWFEAEADWIKNVEFDASTTTAAAEAASTGGQGSGAGGTAAGAKVTKRTEDSFVRAPPGVTRNTCSIDFEEMKSTYSEELQDWVFTNAVMYGGKIVHATCLADMRKGQQGTDGALGQVMSQAGMRARRSATPESTLGKRKAEEGLLSGGSGGRMRVG